ncbi:MAG: ADP-ribosylglycohydrolase family protein [Desulfobacterales bacterium]
MKKKEASLFCRVVLLIAISGFLSSCGCSETKVTQEAQVAPEVQYRKLSLEDYEDKVAGGWLGQAIGVLFAGPTEFLWPGEMVPFDLEDWYTMKPEIMAEAAPFLEKGDWAAMMEIKKKYKNDKNNWQTYTPTIMSNQDDLYIEFLFLHSIQKNGLDVTGKQMAEDWVKYLEPRQIWGANKAAYENFKKGVWPPESGRHPNSNLGNAIDFQIESDLFGLISPGMPRVSNAWADKAGHIMNYGDGVYAGMAMDAMYGEAFFESDPRKLVEYSLKVIPAESGYAEMVRDVIAAHDRSPDDWQAAWREIHVKWGKNLGLDVRTNGAYVYLGLLYGNGEIWKTMNVSMRSGLDSDCNPSSSAGIVGTALGLSGIPEKWAMLRNLPIDNSSFFGGGSTLKEIYPNPISWDDILDATVEVGKKNILANGGKIENGTIYIPHRTPTVPPLEQVVLGEIPQPE